MLGAVPSALEQQAAELDLQDKQRQQQQQPSTSEAADAADATSSSSSSGQTQEQEQAASSSSSDDVRASLESKGVPADVAAAVDAALKLDDDTLAAVSRTIMGRLDIVDLVGKNTAYEVAERVSWLVGWLLGWWVCLLRVCVLNANLQCCSRPCAQECGIYLPAPIPSL